MKLLLAATASTMWRNRVSLSPISPNRIASYHHSLVGFADNAQ